MSGWGGSGGSDVRSGVVVIGYPWTCRGRFGGWVGVGSVMAAMVAVPKESM